jgi:hypothetical protein
LGLKISPRAGGQGRYRRVRRVRRAEWEAGSDRFARRALIATELRAVRFWPRYWLKLWHCDRCANLLSGRSGPERTHVDPQKLI